MAYDPRPNVWVLLGLSVLALVVADVLVHVS